MLKNPLQHRWVQFPVFSLDPKLYYQYGQFVDFYRPYRTAEQVSRYLVDLLID
ncbi:hypothetical protein ABLL52_07710 [Pasteurella multocida]|uniref:hypothetical protein n=1 Tax=Pasteurella multocida TaxID=747 RepID=UPI00031358A9|nr:hypothetical protein [Pasteurella multocida]